MPLWILQLTTQNREDRLLFLIELRRIVVGPSEMGALSSLDHFS
jgi:hypothetical protein